MPEASTGDEVEPQLVQRYIPVLQPKDGDPALAAALFLEAVAREARRHKILLTVSSTEQPPPTEAVPSPHSRRRRQVPDPSGCRTKEDLLSCLRALVRRVPVPNVRELAARATAAGHPLSKSTAARILSDKGGVFPTFKAFEAILLGCGLSDSQVQEWTRAWNRCQREPRHAEDWFEGTFVALSQQFGGVSGAAPTFQVVSSEPSPLLETVAKWAGFPPPDGVPGGRQVVIEPIALGTRPVMHFVHRPAGSRDPHLYRVSPNCDSSVPVNAQAR